MSGEITTFNALPIGARFTCNGNRCIKRSQRTARLIAYGLTFYFRRNEVVTLGHAA